MTQTGDNLEFSANIILLGYNAVNIFEFDSKFKSILKLDSLKEFKFSKEQIKVEYDDDIPESLRGKLFVPATKHVDKTKKISVEYLDFEKKLQIHDNSLSNIILFKKLSTTLVEEQSSSIVALGFNFSCLYKSEAISIPAVLLVEKALKESSPLKNKNIESLEIRFSYFEDEYQKSFKLSKPESNLKILANYHYDKLQNESLTSKIRDSVIKEIEEHYQIFLNEFKELSQGIADNAQGH